MNTDAFASINEEMNSEDWSCLDTETIDNAFDVFLENFHKCIDSHAPSRMEKISKKYVIRKPWMTKGLLVSVKTKEKLFTKCRGKSKDHNHYLRYLAYKSMFSKVNIINVTETGNPGDCTSLNNTY